MADARPDPDALLAKVQREEQKQRHGRLKIFLGAAAGVGKTYAMLSDARAKRAEGIDVVVGVVETHGRTETEALLDGLELLPQRSIEYRGARLGEFDLDAALERRPQLILVDELAHTNAEGSRHPKRCSDVEELLDAGIDVHTTLNVQHLESLNDVVGQITGIRVWETVPDSVFDHADEVELVDLPPDDLLERLKEGKVYLPQQAEHAIRNFFRKGNLIALRELALRRTAERVEDQMRDYREDAGIREVWHAGERILVCIGPGPLAEKLIRAGRRLAAALHGEWTVAYVETPQLQRLPPRARDAILDDLRLAEKLGAATVTLSGPQMSTEILDYAQRQNITKIVLGRPRRSGWQRWLLGSVVDTIVRQAKGADVFLLSGDEDGPLQSARAAQPLLARSSAYLGVESQAAAQRKSRYPGYAWMAAVIAACTAVAWLMHGWFELVNLVMVYLLGVVLVAALFGRGPSIAASVLGVAAFDFFFVPPYFSFAVSDTQYLVTFAVMLLVALVISNLTAGIRQQARIAGYRERRMAALYAMSRELAATRGEDNVLRIGVKHISEVFLSQAVILLPDADGRIRYPKAESINGSLHGADLAVAQWVYDRGQPAGLGTDTLPAAEAYYLPLTGSSGPLGALAILPANLRRVFVPEQHRMLDAFANQVVLAIERVRLADQAHSAQVRVESERLRNALLSAISHDLRTPLAVIVGGLTSLFEEAARMSPEQRREIGQTVIEEAQRMTGLVNNVLDMARLEAGATRLNLQWYPLEELIGSVLHRLAKPLAAHQVEVKLAPDLPLALVDGVLIEQVLSNLLENAAKYTPPGTQVLIAAEPAPDAILVTVADNGPGLPPGEEERVFDKFHRAAQEAAQSGFGLGLTICRAIVEAHGGRIWARSKAEGGAVFHFLLPQTETPPRVEEEPQPLAAQS